MYVGISYVVSFVFASVGCFCSCAVEHKNEGAVGSYKLIDGNHRIRLLGSIMCCRMHFFVLILKAVRDGYM